MTAAAPDNSPVSLEEMSKTKTFIPQTSEEDSLFSLLKGIFGDSPFLTRLNTTLTRPLKSINDAQVGTTSLLKETGHTTPLIEEASKNLPVVGVAINSLDFLRIPLIYLAAAYLGKEVPFTLNDGSKFMYAGVLLGLGIASFVVPFAAPIIGIVIASLALAAHVLIFKGIWDKSKRVDALPGLIEEEEKELAAINTEADELLKKKSDKPQTVTEAEVDDLNKKYKNQVAKIQALYDEQATLGTSDALNHKMQDRSLFMTASGGALAGTILASVAPAVAPVVLIPALLLSGVYLFSRYVIAPRVMQLRAWFSGGNEEAAEPNHASVDNRSFGQDTTTRITLATSDRIQPKDPSHKDGVTQVSKSDTHHSSTTAAVADKKVPTTTAAEEEEEEENSLTSHH
jgi:hypothetical protein